MNRLSVPGVQLTAAAGALLAVAFFAGCGSGGGSSTPGGTTGGTTGSTTGSTTAGGTTGATTGSTTGGDCVQKTSAAMANLNAGIRLDTQSNGVGTNSPLVAASNSFAQLYGSSCNTNDIAAGYAITQARLAGDQIQALFARTFPLRSARSGTGTFEGTLASALTLWRLPKTLHAGGLPGPMDLLSALKPPPAAPVTRDIPSIPAGAQALSNLSAADARLASAQAALKTLLASPNYVFTVADPNQPTNTSATVKVGNAEFQALAAVIDLSRALANLGSAYNLNAGNYNYYGNNNFSFNAPITPAQYFPPSPFGVLTGTGATNTKTALAQLNLMTTDAVGAVNLLEGRSNRSGYLFGTVSTLTLEAIKASVLANQNILAGPSTTTIQSGGQSYTVPVNLPAFLNAPPADLKALLPTLTPAGQSGGRNLVTRTFPDLTFGGLFPSGIPAAAFNPTAILSIGPTDSIAGVEDAALSLDFGTPATTGPGAGSTGLAYQATRIPGDGSDTTNLNTVSFAVQVTGTVPDHITASATNSANNPVTMGSVALSTSDGGHNWAGTIINFPNKIVDNAQITTTVTAYDSQNNVLATANSSF